MKELFQNFIVNIDNLNSIKYLKMDPLEIQNLSMWMIKFWKISFTISLEIGSSVLSYFFHIFLKIFEKFKFKSRKIRRLFGKCGRNSENLVFTIPNGPEREFGRILAEFYRILCNAADSAPFDFFVSDEFLNPAWWAVS